MQICPVFTHSVTYLHIHTYIRKLAMFLFAHNSYMYVNECIICVFNYHLGVNPILSIDDSGIADDSATLICGLSCFSSDLRCVVSHLATNDMDIDVTSVTGHVTGSIMDYSYPTQSITLNCLNSGTTYNYCVIATNTTNMVQVGEPVCGSFTTRRTSSENNDGMCVVMYICNQECKNQPSSCTNIA